MAKIRRRRDNHALTLYSRPAKMIWQNLKPTDAPALISLQQACYAADGYFAIPIEWDFEQAIADSVASQCMIYDDEMIAAAWLRESGGLLHLRMLAHPDHRELSPKLIEWAQSTAHKQNFRALRIHDQAVTEAADSLYTSHGFTRIFAEDVMHHDPLLETPIPNDPRATANSPLYERSEMGKGRGRGLLPITFHPWTVETAPQFYTAYTNAFITRPGFNPPLREEWIADHQDDTDFRPDLSYVALQDGEPIGFVVSGISTTRNIWGERGGWIDQVGVIPAARGKGLASDLIFRAMNGMSDVDHILLHVNVNNPNALRLYQHLGFTLAGRRARYEKALT